MQNLPHFNREISSRPKLLPKQNFYRNKWGFTSIFVESNRDMNIFRNIFWLFLDMVYFSKSRGCNDWVQFRFPTWVEIQSHVVKYKWNVQVFIPRLPTGGAGKGYYFSCIIYSTSQNRKQDFFSNGDILPFFLFCIEAFWIKQLLHSFVEFRTQDCPLKICSSFNIFNLDAFLSSLRQLIQ